MTRIIHKLLLGCLLFVAPSLAMAEPSPADIATARELFRDGSRLVDEQKWEAALDAYQRSMALRPSNLTRYSIAVVQERMGRLIEAMENFREFIASEHDSATKRYVPAAQELVRTLEKRIGRIKIIIPGNPRGAQVRIGDSLIPEAAIGILRPTDPGQHRIEARVPGYQPFVKLVDLKEGAVVDVVVRLGESGDVEESTSGTTFDATVDSGSKSTAVLLTVAGAGVFVAGLGLGVYGYSKASSAETREGPDADKARRMALFGDIGMGVGLVVAGVGTYMLMTGGESESSTSALHVGPWAGHDGAGIIASGSF